MRLFARILTLLALLAVGAPLHAAAHPAAGGVPPTLHGFGRPIALQGSLLPRLASARAVAPLASSTPMQVEVSLRIRDQAGLQSFLREVYDPHSPLYHQFLTPRQFAARFAPTPDQRAQVVRWLRTRGLRVTGQTGNGLLIEARGTARQTSSAFNTRLYTYVQGHDRFFANATPVNIPALLAPSIVSVGGLNSAVHMRPLALHRLARLHPQRAAQDHFSGYTPNDLRLAYDLNPLYQANLDGSGQTIALAEFSDYRDRNVAVYDQQFSISAPSIERVSVPINGRPAKLSDGEDEVELDIEVVHAIAPRAQILVYESPNTSSSAIPLGNRILSDGRARVVSISWGTPETKVQAGDANALDQVAQEAAAQGVSIFVASGDDGAFTDPKQPSTPVVSFPASDPWVTAVGGTSLYLNDSGYQSEEVWSNPSDPSGSGGGLSIHFQRPAYQTGPGVDNRYSNGMRQVPDVAADADYRTGYAVYTVDSHGQAGWLTVGGTSASAPFWGAYVALLNQFFHQNLGFLNPTLYILGQKASTFQNAPFHDVTQGNNLCYPATPGWDFGTGWGSMDGTALLNDIQAIGGPVAAPPTSAPGPGAQPTPAPSGDTISYHVQARWEAAGSKGGLHSPALARSRKGRSVQMALYLLVDSAPPGLAVKLNFQVVASSKVVAKSTAGGNLDTTSAPGTYRLAKSFKPTKPGVYTFLGRATLGDQVIERSATLIVTR